MTEGIYEFPRKPIISTEQQELLDWWNNNRDLLTD